MDITKGGKELKAFKYLNGETVNYSVIYFAVTLVFLLFKQLLKVAAGLSAGLSVGISAGLCAVVLFFLEKRYVFNHTQRGSALKQALLYVFRCGVDFGFYKISSFVFVTMLKGRNALPFFMCFFIYLFFNYYFDRLIVFDCIKKAENNKNGRCYKLFWNNRYVVLSMILASAFLLFFYLFASVFPFGDATVLRMDLYHQYGPLFCELYDRVAHHQSFLYSWISGGGSSFLGNFYNYLSSPLSLIIFLFDRKQMPFAITTIVAVKHMLCAGTFTYYVKASLKRHSVASACFGVFYAFSSYFLAYYWNVMWLDGMFWFPIVMLGIEKIINECKPLCYIVSLVIVFFSTYYMAYMICIFSIVYFVGYYILKHSFDEKITPPAEGEKKFSFKALLNIRLIRAGLIFAGASIFAALLCAVSLVPVYLILQNSSATSDSFPSSFDLYYDLLNLVTSHLAALETTIRSSGDDVLPNVYCGIFTLLLLPLYIINKKIGIKEKAVYIVIILFFIFSFNNNMANFVWHAFHFPNDLPFRFSFMYSFILLIVAFRTLMNFDALEYRDLALSGMFWCFTVILLQKYMTTKMSTSTIYINLGLVVAWTAFLLILHNKTMTKALISVTLVFFVFAEVCISDIHAFPFNQEYTHYVEKYDTVVEAIDHTKKEDKSFYRMELSELNTRMDSCLFGYPGMSTFSSMAYEEYSGSQYTLGMYGNRINSYTYYTQTPVYNMFYSLKYIMNHDDSLALSPDYYEKKYTTSDKKIDVYENKYFLPIAFLASDELEDLANEEGNPFEAQEDLIDRACGVSDIFVPAEFSEIDYTNVDCDDIEAEGTYYFSKTDPDDSNCSIDITVEAVNDSNLYVYISSPKLENVNYYWNDEEDTAYQNIDTPYIMDLGKHKKGDEIRISLDCGSIEEDSSYFEIYAYNIDYDKFVSAYETLKQGALNITDYSDTRIKGTVNAGYTGYLYTSIPYDENWRVYIDGVEADILELPNYQLYVEMEEGEHTVEFRYMPKGVLYGAAGTIAAWIGAGLFWLLKNRKKKKQLSEQEAEFVEIV